AYIAFDLDYLYFFFQAEDGIRDDLVTGVQTCAFRSPGIVIGVAERRGRQLELQQAVVALKKIGEIDAARIRLRPVADDDADLDRSEERRVGKECRGRWALKH